MTMFLATVVVVIHVLIAVPALWVLSTPLITPNLRLTWKVSLVVMMIGIGGLYLSPGWKFALLALAGQVAGVYVGYMSKGSNYIVEPTRHQSIKPGEREIPSSSEAVTAKVVVNANDL